MAPGDRTQGRPHLADEQLEALIPALGSRRTVQLLRGEGERLLGGPALEGQDVQDHRRLAVRAATHDNWINRSPSSEGREKAIEGQEEAIEQAPDGEATEKALEKALEGQEEATTDPVFIYTCRVGCSHAHEGPPASGRTLYNHYDLYSGRRGCRGCLHSASASVISGSDGSLSKTSPGSATGMTAQR